MKTQQTSPSGSMRRLVRKSITTPAGGKAVQWFVRFGIWSLAIGWVTKWTPRIKPLFWKHRNGDIGECWELHVFRFRVGLHRDLSND